MIKKTLIIFVVAFAVIGYFIKDIVDPQTAVLNKLDKFSKVNNLYYEADIKYKHMGMVYNTITIKQYKNRDHLHAIMINPLSKGETIIDVSGDNIRFFDNYITYEGTKERSQKDNSLFWFDKIQSLEIEKDTIRKIKPNQEVETIGLKCKMYTARLKSGNKNIDLCFDGYIPVYIKYYKANNFLPAMFNIKLNEYQRVNNGDVTVTLKNIKSNTRYDKSFDLPKLQSGAPVNVDTIKNKPLQREQFILINQVYDDLDAPAEKK